MSKRVDLGPVLPIHKGEWKAGTTYERLNTVRHNSASWVCKAITTTAEPSTTSADWFLQSEDSVSVASVNGQTGVVTITNTLTTPTIDDDSTLIANTAWVTDKIEQVVTDVDTLVTTTASNTLTQANTNTSTVVADAIKQINTANDSKFATKTEVDVVRVNAVDIVKDQVIDGVKTFSKPIEGSITGTSTKASQDALGNTINTTYTTKTELETEIQAVEKTIVDTAASIKVTTDKLAQDVTDVDSKISTLDTKLTNDITTAQNIANAKISKSGNRGMLAGFETAEIITGENNEITISTESADFTVVVGANSMLTVSTGDADTVWVKTVAFSTDNVMISLGENWSWNQLDYPDTYRNSVLILAWFNSFGIATLVKGDV